jgi:hypothetical protein
MIVFIVRPKFQEYNEYNVRVDKNNFERKELEEQIKKIESQKEEENIKLQALKPIYASEVDSSADNLGMFGNMFEDIIRYAQNDGLLIRSIEYDLRPSTDLIYQENANAYNVCELKFFFVGTYMQLQSFLNDMNNNFQYLVHISKLDVTAFTENTDYLLVKTSITIYSKKSEPKKKKKSKKTPKKQETNTTE